MRPIPVAVRRLRGAPTAAIARWIGPALAAAALGACNVPLDVGGPCASFGTGESPCREQIYFPTGIAIDPDYDTLYVTSSNADLRYSGGTVAAIDLKKFDCALRYVQGGRRGAPEGCAGYDLASLTSASAAHPNRDCHPSALDPGIVECDEEPFISSAVRVGNFGGSLRLQRFSAGQAVDFPVVEGRCPSGSTPSGMVSGVLQCRATPGFSRRLWLPVRGDPSITYVDVIKDAGGARLVCDDPNTPNGNLPKACTNQRITVRDFHGTSQPITPIPAEPFGIDLDEGVLSGGARYARLAVAHLAGGEVTLVNAAAFHPASTDQIFPEERVVLDVRAGFFGADANGRHGAFAVGPRRRHDPNGSWYVSSKASPQIASFSVTDIDVVVPRPGFFVGGGPLLSGDDVRDFAFEPSGDRAFFLDNHPPSVLVVDSRIDADGMSAGLPTNAVVDAVSTCQGPSHLGLRQWLEPGPEGAPSRPVTRLYVVCYTTGQVLVVDPDLPLVLATIIVGSGSNDIAFNFDARLAGTPPPGARAYVTNYLDMTVSVIDLERGSPTEHRVIGRIGLTSPAVTM